MSWSQADLLLATGGKSPSVDASGGKNIAFSGVSTDTRTLNQGDLYVAIKGDFFDGHRFVAQALSAGAALALVSEFEPFEESRQARLVLVEDTRIALGKFSSWHRQQISLQKLIGITGSNGKTTCKNMVEHLLSSLVPAEQVLATEGNLNNDFGVPRTLLSLTDQHQFAVVEMGANHPKEIDYVSRLAKPEVAIITIAAMAHIEGFGSLDGVVKTKAEIMNGMEKGSTIILNVDSVGFEYWQYMATEKGIHILTFGSSEKADFRLISVEQNTGQLNFRFTHDNHIFQADLPMVGEHNAFNALASMAACFAAGFKLQQLIPPLVNFAGIKGRLQQYQLPNGLLLDDSYNANPDSVKAAIDALVKVSPDGILCLGAMAEIGETSADQHKQIANYAKGKGVAFLLCTGEETKNMPEVFGDKSFWFEDKSSLAEKAIDLIKTKQASVCLVKGSRSAKMEQVVKNIIEGMKIC